MPKLTNTFTTTNAVGNRESLDDVVSQITPEDTPLYSMIGSQKATAKFEEWETDTLRTPADNVVAEGDEFTFNASTPVERVGNHTQILRESLIFSKTQEAVANAGKAEQFKRKKLNKAIELKKDLELAFLSSNASNASETGRRLGSLSTWIKTNVNRGAGGVNGGYSSGTKLTVAPTNGTQRAFTKSQLDDVLSQVYTSGGTARYLMISPYLKRVFSSFMSDPAVIPLRNNVGQSGKTEIVGAVDMYRGDFDTVTVVPNRVMANSAATARNAFIIDPSLLKTLKLRPFMSVKPAVTGDAEREVIIGEMTLKVSNERGLGVIADLFGLSAIA